MSMPHPIFFWNVKCWCDFCAGCRRHPAQLKNLLVLNLFQFFSKPLITPKSCVSKCPCRTQFFFWHVKYWCDFCAGCRRHPAQLKNLLVLNLFQFFENLWSHQRVVSLNVHAAFNFLWQHHWALSKPGLCWAHPAQNPWAACRPCLCMIPPGPSHKFQTQRLKSENQSVWEKKVGKYIPNRYICDCRRLTPVTAWGSEERPAFAQSRNCTAQKVQEE